MAAYDAFVSYSHAKDKPIAAALQSVVQKLGKPWYRRRALRVFRDDTSLSATPHLWPSIEQSLGQSRFLILLASPEAAASPWVNKEVAYWLDHKGADTLLFAMTDGELAWDNAVGDFGWREGMPLPPALIGRFASEPKWVDLRAYRDRADTSDAKFTELAADFAAAIHGTPKEDLLSQEVRQQRRALTLAWSAVAALLVLTGVAGWQWKVATDAERAAVEQRQKQQRKIALDNEGAAIKERNEAQRQRNRTKRALSVAMVMRGPEGPSFACTEESLDEPSPVEILVCTDAELVQWDVRLYKAYQLVHDRITNPGERMQSLLSQRDWLNRRTTQCDGAPDKRWESSDLARAKACVLEMTRERVAELEAATSDKSP